MKVFIGGSISIKALDDNVITRLDGIINKNLTVLIGDAYGADKEVQQYFASHKYKAVTVYTSSDKARNNVARKIKVSTIVDSFMVKTCKQYFLPLTYGF